MPPGHKLLRRVPRLVGVDRPARRPRHRCRYGHDLRSCHLQHVRVFVHALDERHFPGEQPDGGLILDPEWEAHDILRPDCLRIGAWFGDRAHRPDSNGGRDTELDIRTGTSRGTSSGRDQWDDLRDSHGQPYSADIPTEGLERERRHWSGLPVHHQRAYCQYFLRQWDIHHPEGRSR